MAIARPDGDHDAGSWTTTPLWSKVDEDPPGDDVRINSPGDPADDTTDDVIFTLSNVADPGVSTGHIIRVEWSETQTGGPNTSITGRVRLYQGDPNAGGSLIATLQATVAGSTDVVDTYTLSNAEADAITDYADLYLRITGAGSAVGGNTITLRVDAVQFEVPDKAAITHSVGGTIAPAGTVAHNVIKTYQQAVGGTIAPAGAANSRIPPAYQHIAPDGDVDPASWTPTPLWDKVDEQPIPDDSDFISSDSAAATTTAILSLATPTDPQTPHGWKLGVRLRMPTGSSATFRIILKDGAFEVGRLTIGDTVLSTTAFTTFHGTLPPERVLQISDLTNLTIEMFADAIVGSVQVDVSWLELIVPDPTATISWAECELPDGTPGPVAWDGKTWAVAREQTQPHRLWLFSADNPTDGHNPAEWTVRRLVHDMVDSLRTPDTAAVHAAALVPNQDDTRLGVIVQTSTFPAGNYSRISPTTWLIDAADQITAAVEGDYPIFLGYRSNGDVVWIYVGSDRTYAAIWDHTSTSQTFVSITSANEQFLHSAVFVGDRCHILIRDADLDNDGQLAIRTLRANDSVFTGATWTTDDLDVRAAAFGGSAGGLVAAAFRRASIDGIDAATWTDADSPTPTRETAATRNARKANYRYTPVLIENGGSWFLLNIDPTDDAIYEAHRQADGTWVDDGEVIVGGNAWETIAARVVAADTAGIITSARFGDIYYYELDLTTGTTFTQSTAGAATPSGGIGRKPAKTNTGSTAPAAALIRATARTLAGTTTPAGSLAQLIQRLLDGNLTPAGSLVAILKRTLAVAGTLTSISGTLTRAAMATLASSISAAGTLQQRGATSLAGTAAPTGAAAKAPSRTDTGTITPAAALLRGVKLIATAAIAPAATLARATARTLTGALTPTGTPTARTRQTLAGAVTLAATITSRAAKTLAGAVTSAGASSHKIVVDVFTVALAGAIASSADMILKTGLGLAAAISPTATARNRPRIIRSGTTAASGAYGPQKALKALAGATTPAGARTATVRLLGGLAGTLTAVTGALSHRARQQLAGTIGAAATLTRAIGRSLAASISPTAALTAIRKAITALAGTIAATGTLRRQTSKALAGTTTPTADLLRLARQILAGTISATGSAIRKTRHNLTATLTLAAAVATQTFTVLAGPISRLIPHAGRANRQLPDQARTGDIPQQGRAKRSI